MTHTHIMLTEQGFVAFQMPNEKEFSGDQWKESDAYKRAVKNGIPFAEEEQNRVMSFVWNNKGFLPYALPDGVEVEIIEVECESICDRACKEYGCDGHTKFAYLKTKEVKEESQDKFWDEIFDRLCGDNNGSFLSREDHLSVLKEKFKVTRI